MAATEEFSFPAITDSYPCGIDSPPLWHLSPAASPDAFRDKFSKEGEERVKEEDDHERFEKEEKHRKSCSYVEKGSKVSRRLGYTEDGEEKMDLLWEDFNEELSRSCSSRMGSSGCSSRMGSSGCSSDVVELNCVQSLKLSKTNGGMFSPKKPSIVVFFKSFRKLFLLHSSHHRLAKHHTLSR
ncbi:hypothetical protein SLE2022_328390 [Rubroshorea leprosula]